MASIRAVQEILDGFSAEKRQDFLHAVAEIVRAFDRNQPKCSPANRRRHIITLLSIIAYAKEEDVPYFVDQIKQMLSALPGFTENDDGTPSNDAGYVLTLSAEVIASAPSVATAAHVENDSQKALLEYLQSIFSRLGVSSWWIGPGRSNPSGGDTSLDRFLLRGIQRRFRDIFLLGRKGAQLPENEVPLLDVSGVAALLGVRIPEHVEAAGAAEDDEPVEHVEAAKAAEDDEPVEHVEAAKAAKAAKAVEDDETVPFGSVDQAHKHSAPATFDPEKGQSQQAAHVVYVPVQVPVQVPVPVQMPFDGQMMVAHMSEEVQNLNAQIAHLMKVNSDQSALLEHLMRTHGYPVKNVKSAYAPSPCWG